MNPLDLHTLDQKSWSFMNLIGQTPLMFTGPTNITIPGTITASAGVFSTVTATTSVVTPLVVSSTAALQLGMNSAATWQVNPLSINPVVAQDNLQSLGDPVARIKQVFTPIIDTGTSGTGFLKNNAASFEWDTTQFRPSNDGTQNFGSVGRRIAVVYTVGVDSGSTGSLSLKTNNGTTGFRVDNVASGVNFIAIRPAATTGDPAMSSTGSDSNPRFNFGAKGSGTFQFFTDFESSPVVQLQILHTASASRNITVTGSNGGNPTISTTAGSLAITPAVVTGSTIKAGAGLIPAFQSTDQTITSAGSLTLAHGLGRTPDLCVMELVCQSADQNYATNDRLQMPLAGDLFTVSSGVAVWLDSTNINVRYANDGLNQTFRALDKTAGNFVALTNSSWKAVFKAW